MELESAYNGGNVQYAVILRKEESEMNFGRNILLPQFLLDSLKL